MARFTQAERKARTRSTLRSAAREAFARHGFGAVSIDVLTEAAGFSRGAFYANYANKQELLLELLQESHEAEILAWREMAETAQDPEELFGAMEARFNAFAAATDWWLLHGELQLHARRDPEFGGKYQAFSQEAMGLLEEMLEAVARRMPHEVRLDMRLAALGLRGLAFGILFESAGYTEAGAVFVLYMRALMGCPPIPQTET